MNLFLNQTVAWNKIANKCFWKLKTENGNNFFESNHLLLLLLHVLLLDAVDAAAAAATAAAARCSPFQL